MAGKLVQVDNWEYSSDVNSVTLTGINSDNIYMLVTLGLQSDSTEATSIRFTESGVANATANYDWSYRELIVSGIFSTPSNENFNEIRFGAASTGNNWDNTIHYIYNANNSSEYTIVASENTRYGTATGQGRQGGGVFTVASAVDGIQVGLQTNGTLNLTAGKMALYKVI